MVANYKLSVYQIGMKIGKIKKTEYENLIHPLIALIYAIQP